MQEYLDILCTAYSKTDLVLYQVNTLSMSSGMTPASFNDLRAYNLSAALAITYSTWAFHLRSSLIITPKSLYDPTRSTSWFYMASNYANSLLVFTLRPQIQFKLNNIIYPTEDLLWWSIRAAKNYFIFYTRTNFQILNFSLEGGEKNGKCFHFFRHCEAEENVCIYATMFCFVFVFVFLKKRSLLNDKWWEAKKKNASWTRATVMLRQSLYFSRLLPNCPPCAPRRVDIPIPRLRRLSIFVGIGAKYFVDILPPRLQ